MRRTSTPRSSWRPRSPRPAWAARSRCARWRSGSVRAMRRAIVPNLWFDTEAEEAAAFYCSVFEDSRVVAVTRYNEAGPREVGMVLTVEFELDGQRFVAINGG